jgi:hypothetical protein
MHPGRLPTRIPVALQTVYLPLIPASTPSERLCKIARTCGAHPRENATTLTPAIPHRPSRRATRAVFVLAAFVSLLVATAPAASAAQSCGRKVLDDWYDGRIDGTYPLHCYDDAIEIIPRDVRDYSSAEDDIKRALQSAMRGKPAPPNSKPPVTARSGDDPTPGNTTEATPATPNDPGGSDAEHPLGESASSVPVPLLILAGLALLLVAGGSAGYLIRRFQNRRTPPPAV